MKPENKKRKKKKNISNWRQLQGIYNIQIKPDLLSGVLAADIAAKTEPNTVQVWRGQKKHLEKQRLNALPLHLSGDIQLLCLQMLFFSLVIV